jgi:CRISPR-associated exonuclease Cas4
VVGWLLLFGVALAALGLWVLARSAAVRRKSGLPAGRVTYADTGAWARCERPLFSSEYRLTGRPDYLVRGRDGVIPVEVKSGRAPAQPYASHILQLAAYCLLVEEQEGRPVPYGIVKYDDRTFEVDFTPRLRVRLLDVLDEMRGGLEVSDVARSHDEVQRCAGCGYRDRCAESLV